MKCSSLMNTNLKILGLFTLLILLSDIVQAQETGYELWSYKTGGKVYDVSVSSDGSYIAAGSGDNKVYFFNRDGKLLWSYEIRDLVPMVSVSSNGSYIGVWSRDGWFYLFDHEGELLQSYDTGWGTGRINDVPLSYDGLYTADWYRKKVYLFDRKGMLFWIRENGHSNHYISASSDGSYIAVPSCYVLYLFNREGKELWSYNADDWWGSVSVSPDGSYVAAASDDKKRIYLFNREGKLLWSYDIGSPVKGVSVSSDGSYVAAGSDKVYLFNREGMLLWSYETSSPVDGVSVSSDGSYVAAGTKNEKVYFFYNSLERLAKCAIEVSEKITKSERTKGFNVVEAEALLPQAEQAFGTGDYARAKELANQAKAFALDIDGDDVPNNSDFAPTIKNVYVYGVAVSLTLASACFTGITLFTKIKRRKYEQKLNEYKAKIEQWEREGYGVLEFKERWFK